MAERDPVFEEPVEEIESPKPKPLRKRLKTVAVLASVPLILIAAAVTYYFMTNQYVSTDNAYVRQDKVSVSALVSGNIVEVAVRENQMVRKGDLLFRIDPEPFKIAIEQANAAIAAAQVRVTGMETELNTSGIDIESAREGVAFYEEEYKRQSELMERGFTTRARLQAAEHALSDARAKLANARADQEKARAALATGAAAPGDNPGVLAAKAQKERAELDLARTVVRAPVSGKVSSASRLQVGQMMQSALPALTIVASDDTWVEANFKETDLARMRVGQPATLTFDAYPDMKLKGHVASIGAGTGSEFSILPAQNASGNWVKVTQRVPVRIAIDGKPSRPLIAGLSTDVRIDTSK
jgi:membrane fusion protein (multidrug efflux system)